LIDCTFKLIAFLVFGMGNMGPGYTGDKCNKVSKDPLKHGAIKTLNRSVMILSSEGLGNEIKIVEKQLQG
jgi:hypothetical protein